MNIKTLIPYDKENPLHARVLLADRETPPYSLFHSPVGEGVNFAKELAEFEKKPSVLDMALLLEQLMEAGETIHIDVVLVEQLIVTASGDKEPNPL